MAAKDYVYGVKGPSRVANQYKWTIAKLKQIIKEEVQAVLAEKKKSKKKVKEVYNWQAKANVHKIKVRWINPRKFTGYAAREKLLQERVRRGRYNWYQRRDGPDWSWIRPNCRKQCAGLNYIDKKEDERKKDFLHGDPREKDFFDSGPRQRKKRPRKCEPACRNWAGAAHKAVKRIRDRDEDMMARGERRGRGDEERRDRWHKDDALFSRLFDSEEQFCRGFCEKFFEDSWECKKKCGKDREFVLSPGVPGKERKRPEMGIGAFQRDFIKCRSRNSCIEQRICNCKADPSVNSLTRSKRCIAWGQYLCKPKNQKLIDTANSAPVPVDPENDPPGAAEKRTANWRPHIFDGGQSVDMSTVTVSGKCPATHPYNIRDNIDGTIECSMFTGFSKTK